MEKRGQAAMEFLMTYGWAILAAVIAIGVLVYFGVFSPGRYTPETCILAAPFGCDDDSTVTSGAAGTAKVDLIVVNGGGEDYVIQTVDVDECDTGVVPADTSFDSGTTKTLTITCTGAVTSGESFRSNIKITYNKVGGTRTLTSTGSISRKEAL